MRIVAHSLALALLVITAARAEFVVGSGTWYSWSTAMLQDNGGAGAGFWDNESLDGSQCNVGFWLTGTQSATCTNVAPGSSGAPGALDFFASSGSRNTAANFEFTAPPPGVSALTLRVEVAGWYPFNAFGYYDSVVTPGSVAGTLFDGFTNPDTAVTQYISPVGQFGFWLQNGDGAIYTSGGSSSFSLFSEVPTNPGAGDNLLAYWIGAEDIATGDRDFQDLLVRVEAVPEPMLGFLLCAGLGVLLYTVTRRRQTT